MFRRDLDGRRRRRGRGARPPEPPLGRGPPPPRAPGGRARRVRAGSAASHLVKGAVMAVQKIGVVGCGLMGSGIAQVAARSGFRDRRARGERGARGKGPRARREEPAAGRRAGEARRGRADEAAAGSGTRPRSRTSPTATSSSRRRPRTSGLKHEIFAALDAPASPRAIFASNTSSSRSPSWPPRRSGPDRVVGLHFFNPVPLMKLVEVVRTVAHRRGGRADGATRSPRRSARRSILAKDPPGSSSTACSCRTCSTRSASSSRASRSRRTSTTA